MVIRTAVLVVSGWAFVCAGCGGSGNGARDGGRSDAPADAGEPDAGRFEPGDAAWPASPCGQPVQHYTVDLAPDEALAGTETRPGTVHGHGERLAVAHYNDPTGTLWMQSVDLTDGSAWEARAELPDAGDDRWHVWAVASWAEPVALVAVRDPARRLLWAGAADGELEVTELAVPAELPWQDVVSFVPTENGFVGLDGSGEGQAYLMRMTRDGIDASPIELPEGGSRVGLAGHAGSPYAVIAASRFEDAPRVELARVGPSDPPSPDDWREVLEGDRAFEVGVTPRRVSVTARRDREVEVVWLDPSLDETGRDRVTLPYPGEAIAVGEERRALVTWGDVSGLAHGLLGETDAPSWRILLDEPTGSARAWRAGSGRHAVVARSGIVTADVFLVCGGEP